MNEPEAARLPTLSREQILWILAAMVVTGWLVWLLGPVLTPFLVSALLAYIADPIVSALERWRMRREMAVSVVFIGFSLLLLIGLLLILPLLIRETTQFFNRLPVYFEQLQTRFLPLLEEQLGLTFDRETFDAKRLRDLLEENFSNIATAMQATWGYLTESGGRFMVWVTGLVLIPLVTFYMMRDWHRLIDTIRDMLPRNLEPVVVRLAGECDEALGGFLRGQVMVMFSLGLLYALGLWMAGLNNGIAIGMIAGLVSFVPYLGAITGVLLAGITAVIQNLEFWFLFQVAMVFVVGQLVESFVLTPRLVGDRIGLHPVLVIFLVMAGGQLFGFIGVLLALPVAAAGTVLVLYFYQGYKKSRIYRESHEAEAREDDE
ncbi:MAG: AI-2E family transporter [Wenzhouxiangella sp.]|jgi:predicted PurR-regulated permease PerM|nr:AI-2E family transporter [Wenzhouxiangella sp.]